MSIARYFNPRLRSRILANAEPEWLRRHTRRDYIVACVLGAALWGDRKAINALRDEAKHLTVATGVRHTLDHIVPLNHPYVCGLHVAANLRVVPHWANAHKSNRFYPDQLELFA